MLETKKYVLVWVVSKYKNDSVILYFSLIDS